jgi:hypothetical protein
MFDTFRRDIINTGLEDWYSMETKAASSIERCMRMCKFKMNKNALASISPHVDTFDFGSPVWGMYNAYGDTSVLARIYPDMKKSDIVLGNNIQTNIRTYALPEGVAKQQRNSMRDMFGACDSSMDAASYFHICTACVLNGKGFKNKLRMCGLTGKLLCNDCETDSVLKINMLGIILRICNSSLYMCATCCNVHIWTGNGEDLTKCTYAHTQIDTNTKPLCSVCASRYVVMGPILYPDPQRKRIARVFMCGKHTIHKHIADFTHSYSGFQEAVRATQHKKTHNIK